MKYMICCNGQPLRFEKDQLMTETVGAGVKDWDAVQFWIPLHAGYWLAIEHEKTGQFPDNFPYPLSSQLRLTQVEPDHWEIKLGPLHYSVHRIRA